MIKKLTLITILSLGLIACSQNFYNERLMKAIENNDIKKVSSILEKQKADINHISESKNFYNFTPLTFASDKGNLEIVKLLVENRASINAEDGSEGNTVIGLPAPGEGTFLVCNTALTKAIEKGNLEIVKYLVENGADIKDNDSNTALTVASRNGNLEVVKYLVENGADINDKDNYGDTALMVASWNGNLEVVKYLVENGADIDENSHGKTALMIASEKDNEDKDDLEKERMMRMKIEMMRASLMNGADINAKNYDDWTAGPFRYGELSYYEIIKYLVENGADINIKYNNGSTVLMKASKSGNYEIVKLLIENGADINDKDNDGNTALMSAFSGNYFSRDRLEIVKYLIKSGADINYNLILASGDGNLRAVKFLVENGADVNAKDNEGNTALSLAKEASLLYFGVEEINEIIKILKEAGAK